MGNEPKTPKAVNIVRPSSYHVNSHTSQTSFIPSTSQKSQASPHKPRITSAQIDVYGEDPLPSQKYRGSQVAHGHLSSSASSHSKKLRLFSPASFTSSNGSNFSSYSIKPPVHQKPHNNGSVASLRDRDISSISFSLSPSSSTSMSRSPRMSHSTHSATTSESHSDNGFDSNGISPETYPEAPTYGSPFESRMVYNAEQDNDGVSQINESDGAIRIIAKVKGGTIVNSRGEVLNKTIYQAEQEARANRKILDLELSNKSLLLLNEQLEAKVQEQEKELSMIKKRSSTEHSTSPFSEAFLGVVRNLDEDVKEMKEIIEEDPIFGKMCLIVRQLIKDAEEGLAAKSKFSNRVLRSADISSNSTNSAQTVTEKSISDMVDEEEEERLAAQRNQVTTF